MATLAVTHPTLLDLARHSDPNGKIQALVEILNETNEILEDMVWVEANGVTNHKTSIRAGLPAPTWRKMYGGIQPSKGTAVQVSDTMGMLEAVAEVDKALADLNGNTNEFRLSEDRAHIEGMNQEMADTLFYGNESTEPEAFTGLAPRYNDTTAANGDNIILGGSAGGQTDNMSIWLVVWGANTVHGIIPKGSKAGLQMDNLGECVVENVDGSGGRMRAYRTWYRWDAGITVKDWRYIVRIPNIDRSLLTADYSTGANIADLMVQAIEMIPSLSMGKPVFYMPRRLRSTLRRQIISSVKNATLTQETIAGKSVTMFDGIPVRRVDALSADEARVA